MKCFKYIILLILTGQLSAQDQVNEILDSLESVYGYQKITYAATTKYNFAPGEIPQYPDEIYQQRIDYLNNYSPFKFSYNKIVRGYINRYTKSPKSVAYILAKSNFYFPMFEKYLNQFQIPLELKNLAIVESALNPTARSHCGATGLWQFMYGTGKAYNLEINSLVDERYDPEKETIIACMYLKDLYNIYKDWPLALAAYNCGPGNVNKAIKRAGGDRNFWAIYDYLPKETQGYVPAFIAASYITTYYEAHNITPANNEFLYEDLDKIIINERTTLKALSKKLKIDYKKLKYLNPQYFTGVVPGINSVLIVPGAGNSLPMGNYQAIELQIAQTTTKIVNNGLSPEEAKRLQDSLDFVLIKLQDSLKNIQATQPDYSQPSSFPQKKFIFGTIYNSERSPEENKLYSSFLSSVKNKATVYAGIPDTIPLYNGKKLTITNKNAFYLNGQYIKENSELYAQVSFTNQSIIFLVTTIKAVKKEIPAQLQGEIIEAPKKGKPFIIDPSYTIILKS